jgi:hypothetical protein
MDFCSRVTRVMGKLQERQRVGRPTEMVDGLMMKAGRKSMLRKVGE